MKPDWKDAPEWAQYLAQDQDGVWYWYELEPLVGDGVWRVPESAFRSGLAYSPKFNWDESCEPRPPTPETP